LGFRARVWSFGFRISGSGSRVSVLGFRSSGLGLGSAYHAARHEFERRLDAPAFGFKFQISVLGRGFQFSGFGFRVWDWSGVELHVFGFWVSGFGVQGVGLED